MKMEIPNDYKRVSARQTLTKFLMITALLLSVLPHITFFASSTTSESYKEVKYTYVHDNHTRTLAMQ